MIRFSQFAAPAAVCGALLVGGCTHERHDEIPPTAAVVTEGTKSVSATATNDGDVYIYDATSNKMVYTGKVAKGQMVKVDAEKNRVMLDTKTLTERDLPNEHHYKIFFDTQPAPAQPSTVQPSTVQPNTARPVTPPPRY